jgi:hypothetical protein
MSKGTASYRRQMREQGYSDGIAGRKARWVDAEYQRSWRRGKEALERRQVFGMSSEIEVDEAFRRLR